MTCFRNRTTNIAHIAFHATDTEYLSHCGVYFMKKLSSAADTATCLLCVAIHTRHGDVQA